MLDVIASVTLVVACVVIVFCGVQLVLLNRQRRHRERIFAMPHPDRLWVTLHLEGGDELLVEADHQPNVVDGLHQYVVHLVDPPARLVALSAPLLPALSELHVEVIWSRGSGGNPR